MKSRILTTWIPLAFAMALVPAAGFAQTTTVSPPLNNALCNARPCRRLLPLPSIRRAPPVPPREICVKLVALIPAFGTSFSYARNFSNSIALEGAFDLVSVGDVTPPAGIGLVQVRFSEDAGFVSKKFVTAGIVRTTTFGEHNWLGSDGFGLALGGGSQQLWTDQAGMRIEFQYLRFEEGGGIRVTLGAFFGFGD
jgi:hypothetical protein